MLHRVVWPQQKTFRNIFDAYISFLERNDKNRVLVAFDGYADNQNSTKVVKRYRRYVSKSSVNFVVDENNQVRVKINFDLMILTRLDS